MSSVDCWATVVQAVLICDIVRGSRRMRGLPVTLPCQLSRPHAGFVVSEWFKSSLCPALIESPWIFDRIWSDRPVRDGELGATELRVPGIDPNSVLQVSQMRCGSLPLGDCRAQGVQE
jgi:hypothetical protein